MTPHLPRRQASLVLAALLLCGPARAAAPAKELPVLIAADEIPAMELLAKQLGDRFPVKATIVNVKKDLEPLPADLTPFRAVVVYIHGNLSEVAEKAFLAYAEGGGNLVLLHHTISSGKRKNPAWFPALGITLPTGEFADGGYKYFDDVTWDLVNLAPRHPILRGVKFPKTVDYNGKKRPALTLEETEIYLNHVLEGPRTPLLGLRWDEPKSGKHFAQDTAAWVKPHGKGRITYFMPGHKKTDFELAPYARMIANAITWNGKM
jgi:hypothetical protein